MATKTQLLFAANVRYYRKQLKLTQAQLAKIINCTASFIGYIETAKTSVSLDTIEMLCIALQVTPATMFSAQKTVDDFFLDESTPHYSPDIAGIVSDLSCIIEKYKKEFVLVPHTAEYE